MAVQCSSCGRGYDVTLFEFNRFITCVCGNTVVFKHEQMTDEAALARRYEEQSVREIQRISDRISSLIVASDYPMIDIEIEKLKLRERISELFPDKIGLYELIYESRFRRLEEQFRTEDLL
jgi:hypothetical protein